MKCFEQSKVVDAILLGTEITEKDRRVFYFKDEKNKIIRVSIEWALRDLNLKDGGRQLMNIDVNYAKDNFDKDSIFATEFPLDTRNGFIEIEGY
tara:strand:+ start:623 stop:904 length:282 start_codon:yes stop_codon:yes gene_type:complete